MYPQSHSSMNYAIEHEFDTSYEKRTRNIKSFKMRVIQFIVFSFLLKVPLRRKFVGLFRPNSVAEYRVVSIFTQKTEQETVHPNIF